MDAHIAADDLSSGLIRRRPTLGWCIVLRLPAIPRPRDPRDRAVPTLKHDRRRDRRSLRRHDHGPKHLTSGPLIRAGQPRASHPHTHPEHSRHFAGRQQRTHRHRRQLEHSQRLRPRMTARPAAPSDRHHGQQRYDTNTKPHGRHHREAAAISPTREPEVECRSGLFAAAHWARPERAQAGRARDCRKSIKAPVSSLRAGLATMEKS